MCLAKERGLVARRLQELGHGLLLAVEGHGVVHQAVDVAVLSGEDDGAARPADRVGDKAVVWIPSHLGYGERGEIVTDNIDDMVRKIIYYMENPDVLKSIQRGLELILNYYCEGYRFDQ